MMEGSYPRAWRIAARVLAGESLDAVYIEDGHVFEFEMKALPPKRPVASVKLPPLFIQLPTIALRWNHRKGKLEDA